MEKLINVQTGKIGEVINRGEKITLNIDGQQKDYSKSTIKRWWKSYEEPQATVQPETAVEPQATTTQSNLPILAQKIINALIEKGCTTKETKSYIGIKLGKTTIMEIHCTKKGKTTLVVNSKAFDSMYVERLVECGFGKVVPESYGWTLNLKISIDSIPDHIATIVPQVVNYARS